MFLRLSNILIISITLVLFIYRDVHSYSPLPTNEEVQVLHSLQTIYGKDMDAIPLKKSDTNPTSMQDATMFVMDVQRNWDNWSPMFRDLAGSYFLRKTISMPYRSMPKVASLSLRKVVNGGHLLPNWVETENFSIEWGNNLSSSDGGTDSGRIIDCSKRLQGLPCTGIPDTVDNWADYFEESHEKEISGLGYPEPTGADSYLYDVYIANTADNVSGNNDDKTPSLGFNYLGLTVTYCDYESLTPICKSNISSSSSYIIVNNSIRDTDTMKITAAHEFFHAIQFGYPTIDAWFATENHWWLEATATWMEDVVYDDVNNYYSRVRHWLREPSLSLKYSGNLYSDHEYGDALFIIFLTDVYLKDKDFVRYVWENDNSGIEAIDDVLFKRYNSGFEPAFRNFVALNAVADIGEERGGYHEGPMYGRAAVTKTHTLFPVPISEIEGLNAPEELGSNYIRFIPPDNNNNRLIIEFDGSDTNNWGAMVVKVRSDGTKFDAEEMILDPLQKNGCHSVDGFGTDYSEVFLVPLVLIDPVLRETAPYYYRASINDTCDGSVKAFLTQSNSQSNIAGKTNNSRCFIATAAFGSFESPYVRILRDFRDRYLMPYNMGQKFVRLYYKLSPSIAEFIVQHPPAPFLVRVALIPAIGIAFLFLKPALIWKISLIIMVFFLLFNYPLRKNH